MLIQTWPLINLYFSGAPEKVFMTYHIYKKAFTFDYQNPNRNSVRHSEVWCWKELDGQRDNEISQFCSLGVLQERLVCAKIPCVFTPTTFFNRTNYIPLASQDHLPQLLNLPASQPTPVKVLHLPPLMPVSLQHSSEPFSSPRSPAISLHRTLLFL